MSIQLTKRFMHGLQDPEQASCRALASLLLSLWACPRAVSMPARACCQGFVLLSACRCCIGVHDMMDCIYLQKFESNIKRLRCHYERMELLKTGSRRPATERSYHNKAGLRSFNTDAEGT